MPTVPGVPSANPPPQRKPPTAWHQLLKAMFVTLRHDLNRSHAIRHELRRLGKH